MAPMLCCSHGWRVSSVWLSRFVRSRLGLLHRSVWFVERIKEINWERLGIYKPVYSVLKSNRLISLYPSSSLRPVSKRDELIMAPVSLSRSNLT